MKRLRNHIAFIICSLLFFLINGKILPQDNIRQSLPEPLNNSDLNSLPIDNEIVRKFVYPKRIVWQTENSNNSEIVNSENLINTRVDQVSLIEKEICIISNKGDVPSILFDFGSELNGGIEILLGRNLKENRDYKNPVKFRVRFGESVSEAMSELNDGSTATNDHAIRDFTLQAPWLGNITVGNTGFRFVRIDLIDSNVTVPLFGIRAVFEYRDIPYIGSFSSSDSLLNQIWLTGAYTVHLNMQHYLWDGIKRDRLVWVGDIHPEAMTILSVFGKNRVVEKSLDFIRDITELPKWMNGISSYSMWWILIHYDWYKYTGDKDYLYENREYMKSLIGHLSEFIGEDNREKLNGIRFIDWPTRSDTAAVHAGLHSLLLMTMKAGRDISILLNDDDLKSICDISISRLKKYVPDYTTSKQGAALAALAGLDDPYKINNEVLEIGGPREMSTFYGYYILKARALAGDINGCIDVIKEYWGGMLKLGATTFWEDFNIEWLDNASRIDEMPSKNKVDVHSEYGNYSYKGHRHSLCHGWASGPTAWMSEYILGIKPLEPGFESVQIKPNLGNLKWAAGTFPTPLGPIYVKHTKNSKNEINTEYKLPDGIKLIRQ